MNVASRMESLCKELGVDTVLSADLASAAGDGVALRSLGEATVKGKAGPIGVFTLA